MKKANSDDDTEDYTDKEMNYDNNDFSDEDNSTDDDPKEDEEL